MKAKNVVSEYSKPFETSIVTIQVSQYTDFQQIVQKVGFYV